MIHLNCDSLLKLPHIELPEIGARFMIDTGSMRSFISPAKANQFFSKFKYNEPFEVISTHARSVHNEVIHIPLFRTFKSTDYHKFYVYDVDNRYDGLIGTDLLKQLDATVDMKHQILCTRDTKIPILYRPPCEIYLEPRTETRVKIPTDLANGTALIEFKDFGQGIRMPTALVTCENHFATTIIQNASNEKVVITFSKPIKVTKFESGKEQIFTNAVNIANCEIDALLKQNLNKLRLDHTNSEEREAIRRLCYEYRDIFYCDDLPLSFTSSVKHCIRTKNEDPIYIRPFRQPPSQNEEIQRQVDKLLENDVIRESHSPWSAPVHLVPKKMDATGERKYRMVVDYRRLNDITTDDKYPLPNITDLFDKLGKSNYFSTIDLASGYHQIEVEEPDRAKTAFTTQSGHYEFKRMPFGLKTAPATFQRAMDNVLRGLQGIHCMVYLDDIIVYSSSLQEHIDKLRLVFDRLRQTNLKVTLDKSEFLRKEVLYLGHQITKDGLQPNDDKIKAVLDFPLPKTPTEIKSFLGLVGYYRKFIRDFSKITQPLTACLKKGRKVELSDEYRAAFQKCKELLVNAPLLQFPDFSRPFVLTTDASNVAIGAVLSQGQIGSDKPIAYASRTLNDAETRYSTIEKELLAIVWAVKHFRPYLYGRKFTIYTDHRPLAWLKTIKEPNSKLTRWKLRLEEFDYDIVYKNGKQNTNADALSRIKLNVLGQDDNISMQVNVDKNEQSLQDYIRKITDEIDRLAADQPVFPNRADTPILISDDSHSVHSGMYVDSYPVRSPSTSTLTASEKRSNSSTETAHSAEDVDVEGIPILREAIDTKPNQILVFDWNRSELSVKDLSRDKQRILEVHLPFNRPDLVKQFLKEYIRPKIKHFIYFEHRAHREQFAEAAIALFRKDAVKILECTERVVYIEDENEQRAIVKKYHQGKTCHRGIRETLLHLKRTYFWNNMQLTVASIINACDTCKLMKYDRKPFNPKLQLTQTQTKPFEEIFIDLFSIEGKYFLTVVDAFSKLGQAFEIPDRTTPEVVKALIKYFSIYGIPKKISSDPGVEFNNALLKEMLAFYKVEIHIGTAHNPNSMGIVERFHSTILEIYRIAKYEQKHSDAASVMTYAIMSYNQTIHSSTGLTPFEVAFGHTDANEAFDVDFDRLYTQKLVRDHARKTKYLYKYLTDRMIERKERVREKRGGETEFNVEEGDTLFMKGANTRRSKDKPRYQKAQATDTVFRNTLPVTTRGRDTQVPIKDIKRPSQVRPPTLDPRDGDPGPSTSRDRK